MPCNSSLAGSRFTYNVNGAAGLENSPDDLAVQVYQAAENTISEGVGGFVGASHLTPKISILWPIAGHSTSAENAKIYAGISQNGRILHGSTDRLGTHDRQAKIRFSLQLVP
jgi:hypothetical protein